MRRTAMFKHKPFYDLSVCCTNTDTLKDICVVMVEFGYNTIAVNQIIEEPEFMSKKKRKKKGEDAGVLSPIPEPVPLTNLRKEFSGKLKIYNRLTFAFSDNLQVHQVLQSPVAKKYDILAAIPKTQASYQFLCSSVNVDLISFDPENQYPVKQHRKMYNLAARRGLYFEIPYVPALVDDTLRRNVLSRGQAYHYFGKSQSIIISSNISSPIHVRGPYDVVNIALLLGLSEEQAKYAISGAPKKLLQRAVCRKLGKIAPILMECESVLPQKQDHAESMDDDEVESCEKRLRQ